MHPIFMRGLIGCAALSMLTACGGGGDDTPDTPVATPKSCEPAALAGVQLAGATVTGAAPVAAGSYTPPGGRAIANLPAFCRITAQATPSADSLINFEIWVPEGQAWNGKMVVTGNGGYSPALSTGDMAYAMRQGYAVVGGDTGHQSADPNEMFWAWTIPRRSATGARAPSTPSPRPRARWSRACAPRRPAGPTTTAAPRVGTRAMRRCSATRPTSTA